ncbi:MAG: DUF4430 domain-containing protein [Clostridia bacterium]|nr:DUF4430 domain-containing protein [Clostridia bacterium]MEE1126606.1 DUF4430 domain-containing protein [Acutalibacteraceae bacterium]
MNEEKLKRSIGIISIAMVIVAIMVVAVPMIAIFSPKGALSENNIATEQATAVEKAITIEVIDSAKKSVTYNVTTDAEFLRGAMDDTEGLEYSGDESQYGIMVKTVNGELADYDKNGAYWSFTVNGEYSNHGIDTQPVNDGDEFVIAYTTL